MPAHSEIEVEATPEEVWEAVSTDEGREAWLGREEADSVFVEVVQAPHRLVWWWDEGRVELEIQPLDAGSRVVVTETRPAFPVTALATAFATV